MPNQWIGEDDPAGGYRPDGPDTCWIEIEDHPVDHLEPESDPELLKAQRETAVVFARWLGRLMDYLVTEVPHNTTLLAIALAVGSERVAGVSMAAHARRVGITRSALSKAVRVWSRRLILDNDGLRSPVQRTASTAQRNRDARYRVLAKKSKGKG